jgi:hypothetical protein
MGHPLKEGVKPLDLLEEDLSCAIGEAVGVAFGGEQGSAVAGPVLEVFRDGVAAEAVETQDVLVEVGDDAGFGIERIDD